MGNIGIQSIDFLLLFLSNYHHFSLYLLISSRYSTARYFATNFGVIPCWTMFFVFMCSYFLLSGAVHIDDITVLGCGAISWKPPRDTGGELPGYIVRFFDGATYDTSRSEDREIQRSFVDDPGRQWAIAENLPSGRTVYADVGAEYALIWL